MLHEVRERGAEEWRENLGVGTVAPVVERVIVPEPERKPDAIRGPEPKPAASPKPAIQIIQTPTGPTAGHWMMS